MSEPTPPPSMLTQVQHPWRSTVRTVFQVGVALATLLPYVVTEAHISVTGGVAQVVGVAAAVTRVMALPGVVEFLQRFAPWLAPAGGTRTPPA